MKTQNQAVLVIAPHPDDETLGCGGTLLKHQSQGQKIYWAIVTQADPKFGFTEAQLTQQKEQTDEVAQAYGFEKVFNLGFPSTRLDQLPSSELVGAIGKVIQETSASTLYIPFPGDVHSDHRVVFDAAAACTKNFRYPSLRRMLAYEVLSETEFGVDPTQEAFKPNVFVDISENLDKKIQIMNHYRSETGKFPFPRSEEAVRSLAKYRGVVRGVPAAEAFYLMKELS